MFKSMNDIRKYIIDGNVDCNQIALIDAEMSALSANGMDEYWVALSNILYEFEKKNCFYVLLSQGFNQSFILSAMQNKKNDSSIPATTSNTIAKQFAITIVGLPIGIYERGKTVSNIIEYYL